MAAARTPDKRMPTGGSSTTARSESRTPHTRCYTLWTVRPARSCTRAETRSNRSTISPDCRWRMGASTSPPMTACCIASGFEAAYEKNLRSGGRLSRMGRRANSPDRLAALRRRCPAHRLGERRLPNHQGKRQGLSACLEETARHEVAYSAGDHWKTDVVPRVYGTGFRGRCFRQRVGDRRRYGQGVLAKTPRLRHGCQVVLLRQRGRN